MLCSCALHSAARFHSRGLQLSAPALCSCILQPPAAMQPRSAAELCSPWHVLLHSAAICSCALQFHLRLNSANAPVATMQPWSAANLCSRILQPCSATACSYPLESHSKTTYFLKQMSAAALCRHMQYYHCKCLRLRSAAACSPSELQLTPFLNAAAFFPPSAVKAQKLRIVFLPSPILTVLL